MNSLLGNHHHLHCFWLFSTRKRQSVVCRYANGRLVLYSKVNVRSSDFNLPFILLIMLLKNAYALQGADNVIYERLADGNDELKKLTREHLEQFGSAGLRTLCLAYRDLISEFYEKWNEKFIQAKSSLRDREKKLDEVCEIGFFFYINFGLATISSELSSFFGN